MINKSKMKIIIKKYDHFIRYASQVREYQKNERVSSEYKFIFNNINNKFKIKIFSCFKYITFTSFLNC